MNSYETILTTLPTLSGEQLTELRKRIVALLSVQSPLPDDDWLLAGIITELKNRGLGGSVPPPARLTQMKFYKSFAPVSQEVRNSIIVAMKRPMSRAERTAMGIIVARALAHYIESFVPVTLMTMMQQTYQTLDAVERAFPGYLGAGVLYMLLSRKGR